MGIANWQEEEKKERQKTGRVHLQRSRSVPYNLHATKLSVKWQRSRNLARGVDEWGTGGGGGGGEGIGETEPLPPPAPTVPTTAVMKISYVTCGLALLSVFVLAFVIAIMSTYHELQAFPMNRVLPLCVTLLVAALSIVLHRLLFLGGYVALDQVCAIEGYTYLISTLSGAGLALTASIQFFLVRVLSPLDASEGCADFHLRTASVLLTIALGLLPAFGMALIVSVSNDSDFWPSPLHTLPHSFEWQRKLFDYPLGAMLLFAALTLFAAHLGVLFGCCRSSHDADAFRRGERGIEGGLRRPRDRLWTLDRVARVLLIYIFTWLPGRNSQKSGFLESCYEKWLSD